MNVQTPSGAIDLAAVKGRQQIAWGSGDYAMIGTTLQIVGESLCEAVDLRSNQRVLDVAAGNGNATLAAARRFADESFDVVLSTFGVMFTPNQQQAANELARVCRRGGKIGLANWTPEGFVGQLFKTIGKYVPPAPGVKSPSLWGTRAHLDTLFGSKGSVAAESKNFVFRYKSREHWLEIFRGYYGPVLKAFAAIEPEARDALEADIYALLDAFNVARDGTLVLPSEYLEVVITKR